MSTASSLCSDVEEDTPSLPEEGLVWSGADMGEQGHSGATAHAGVTSGQLPILERRPAPHRSQVPWLRGARSVQLRPVPGSSVPRALEIRPCGSRPSQASPPWGPPSALLWPEPSQCWLPLQPAPATPCPTPSAFQGLRSRSPQMFMD